MCMPERSNNNKKKSEKPKKNVSDNTTEERADLFTQNLARKQT